MMEAAIPPLFPIDFEHLDQAGAVGQVWSLLVTPDVAQEAILNQNMFIEAMLPQMVVEPLDQETLKAYGHPSEPGESFGDSRQQPGHAAPVQSLG